MTVLILILLIAAVVCFGLAAINVAARPNLIALGLFLLALSLLIPAIGDLAHK
jgi:hypothetical protein